MCGGRVSLSHLFLSAHEVLGAKVCTTMAGNCEWYNKYTNPLYFSLFKGSICFKIYIRRTLLVTAFSPPLPKKHSQL